jgi:hypothetical protein
MVLDRNEVVVLVIAIPFERRGVLMITQIGNGNSMGVL